MSLTLSSGAFAAPPPEDDAPERREAKAHYELGVAAYREGRFERAVEEFRTADSLAPSAALSFNVARAYEKLGEPARALEHYRDYLRRMPDATNAVAVKNRIRELERKLVARRIQQLTVMSEPSGAELVVDGQAVGETPWTGELAPGIHRLELRLAGHAPLQRNVDLSESRALDVHITLQAQAAPHDVQTPPGAAVATPAIATGNAKEQPKERPSFGPWPWIAIGGGGAALLGATAFELLRRDAETSAEAEEVQTRYVEKYEQMESRQKTARILAGVGGALVIGGGVLLLVDHQRAERDRSIAFSCDTTSCLGTVRGRF